MLSTNATGMNDRTGKDNEDKRRIHPYPRIPTQAHHQQGKYLYNMPSDQSVEDAIRLLNSNYGFDFVNSFLIKIC